MAHVTNSIGKRIEQVVAEHDPDDLHHLVCFRDDEKQDALHTLNFVSTYRMNDRVSLKMQLNDLLGQDIVFRQATRSGKSVEVERYGQGTSIEIGVSCQF